MALKIIFMGSDRFAVPAFEALNGSEHGLQVCVTQPDRPQGRGRHLASCPVKQCAEESGVSVLTPEKIGDAVDALAAFGADLAVVAAYGQYLPKRILALPRLGFINIHPSLLPEYRGAAPMQWAVADGKTETGVTIQQVVSKMDAGPVLLQERFVIAPEDTFSTIEPRLAAIGARLMLKAIAQLESATAQPHEQDESKVTWARKLEKQDGLLDWSQAASVLHNRVRGFQPWPGTFCVTPHGRLKVFKTGVEADVGEPGTLLDLTGDGPLVACADGALRLLEVQPEGKRAMPGGDYLRGCRLAIGTVLG